LRLYFCLQKQHCNQNRNAQKVFLSDELQGMKLQTPAAAPATAPITTITSTTSASAEPAV